MCRGNARDLAAPDYSPVEFGGRFANQPFGIEAAHVKWHSHDGPSTVDNGLCLCTLHHKALDRGVIGVDQDYKLLVSMRLEENEHTEKLFFGLAGGEVKAPRDGFDGVAEGYRRWHTENVYKG